MQFERLLSARTGRMQASAIREILKLVSQPGMLSLAGGIPAPESFPVEIMKELSHAVVDKFRNQVFQYGLTEGFYPLREALVSLVTPLGIAAGPEDIFISTGSQGVLDAIGKILISKGDKVALESPTYLGAIQAFNPYEPEYINLESDDDGVVPESVEAVLVQHEIKFIYLVPTFQNPSGRTLSLTRRRRIADLAQKYDALVVEDDPYSALRYAGEKLPALKSLAPENVIYLGTLSKVLAPGLRIGYYLAPESIAKWLVTAKQGADLHTSSYNQAIAAEYISRGFYAQHLPNIIALYEPRRQAMLRALETYFPENFKWSRPEGGMFVWVECPAEVDVDEIYAESVRRGAAFVPGKHFFAQPGAGNQTMRLNFTLPDPEKIEKALKIISDVIREKSAN